MADAYQYRTQTALLVEDHIRERAEKNPPDVLRIELHRQENVSTYSKRLDYAERNPKQSLVNATECKRLLSLWQDMTGKTWQDLSFAQRDEVLDSMVSDGEYDQDAHWMTAN